MNTTKYGIIRHNTTFPPKLLKIPPAGLKFYILEFILKGVAYVGREEGGLCE